MDTLDRIFVRNLLVRGIVGMNPEERANSRIQVVELTVEKPGAVRFSQSVGLTILRRRAEVDL